VIVYGDNEKQIDRVASFCGAGADEKAVLFAKKEGAQVIVSSDFKHHVLTMAVELGLAVIVMTHYASENYGMKKYYEKIRQQVEIPCEYHTDENLL
jgi:putative NIF3 family GTP cyclohydrolase 1 type 2